MSDFKITSWEESSFRVIWHDMWCSTVKVEASKLMAWFLFIVDVWIFGTLAIIDYRLYLAWMKLFG